MPWFERSWAVLAIFFKPGGRIYMSWADFADLQFIAALFDVHAAHYKRLDDVSDGTSFFVAYKLTLAA